MQRLCAAETPARTGQRPHTTRTNRPIATTCTRTSFRRLDGHGRKQPWLQTVTLEAKRAGAERGGEMGIVQRESAAPIMVVATRPTDLSVVLRRYPPCASLDLSSGCDDPFI